MLVEGRILAENHDGLAKNTTTELRASTYRTELAI
jgi:hypothetical protein